MRKLLILAAIGLTANLATSCGSDESGSSSSPGVDVTGVWAVPGSGGWAGGVQGYPRLPSQFIAWEDSVNCQNCGQIGARLVGKALLQNTMTPTNPQWSCTPDNYQHQAWMDVFAEVADNTVTGTFTSSINQAKCSTAAGGNCSGLGFPARFDITLKVVFSATIEWSPNPDSSLGICALVSNFTKTMVGPNAAEAPEECNNSGDFVFYLSEFDRPLWSGPPYCSELNLLDHTADLTFGSTTVTMDDTSQLVVGKNVISVISSGATLVQTDDLPNGTTVASITDSTTFEVSLAAQATVTNASLMFLLTLPQECMEPDTKWIPKAVTEEECFSAAPPAS